MSEEIYHSYQMIADCSDCNVQAFNKYNFAIFGKDVAFEIGLVPFGPSMTMHSDNGDPQRTGWMYFQIMEGLAHISGTFIDGTKEIYLDIVSNKEFDAKVVEDIIKRYFSPNNIKTAFLARKA